MSEQIPTQGSQVSSETRRATQINGLGTPSVMALSHEVNDELQPQWIRVSPGSLRYAQLRQPTAYAQGLTFAPGADAHVNDDLNLWNGWGLTPDDTKDAPKAQLFLEYLRTDLSTNEEGFKTLFNYLADIFQNPGQKPEKTLMLNIEYESANSMPLIRILNRLLGGYFKQYGHWRQLNPDNKVPLATNLVSYFAWGVWLISSKARNAILAEIEADRRQVTWEGFAPVDLPACTHAILEVPPLHVLDAEHEPYFVRVDVPEFSRTDHHAMEYALGNGGYEQLLHLLLTTRY